MFFFSVARCNFALLLSMPAEHVRGRQDSFFIYLTFTRCVKLSTHFFSIGAREMERKLRVHRSPC